MRERSALSGSGLFLIELLFGLMIFALTAAICLEIFVGSYKLSNETNRLNHAVFTAQNGAEFFRATGGDLEETARLLDGMLHAEGTAALKYFDADWNPVVGAGPLDGGDIVEIGYVLEVRAVERIGYIGGLVLVSDVLGNVIFSIPIASLGVSL